MGITMGVQLIGQSDVREVLRCVWLLGWLARTLESIAREKIPRSIFEKVSFHVSLRPFRRLGCIVSHTCQTHKTLLYSGSSRSAAFVS